MTNQILKLLIFQANSENPFNNTPPPHQSSYNRFELFNDTDRTMPESSMEIDNTQTSFSDHEKLFPPDTNSIPLWSTDTMVTTVSEKLFLKLNHHQQLAKDAGKLESDAPIYYKPEKCRPSPKA
jgi:hypothetical protein